MRKDLFMKALVFVIMLVFVTISTLPSVTSNSNSAERPINPILVKDTQTNHSNDYYYEIIWAGTARAEFQSPLEVNLTVDCGPSYEKNISIPGPDLILVFLYKTEISSGFFPLWFPRIAYYVIKADIDDDKRGDTSAMKVEIIETKSNILGMGYLIENACNTTVEIKVTTEVKTYFPRDRETCEFTVILNITCP
jgi:hypothetical protein